MDTSGAVPIRFRVVGIPATQGSKTAFRSKNGKMIVTDSARKTLAPWKDDVRRAAAVNAPKEPLATAVQLVLTFFLPAPKSLPKRQRIWHTKKPDLSKLVRAVEDACTGIIWRDDSQVTDLAASKHYAYGCQPGVLVVIAPLWGEPPGPPLFP